jgi:hypothetical protein
LLCSAVGIWPCSTHRAALFVDFFFFINFPHSSPSPLKVPSWQLSE